jgi:hypothetical protein
LAGVEGFSAFGSAAGFGAGLAAPGLGAAAGFAAASGLADAAAPGLGAEAGFAACLGAASAAGLAPPGNEFAHLLQFGDRFLGSDPQLLGELVDTDLGHFSPSLARVVNDSL